MTSKARTLSFVFCSLLLASGCATDSAYPDIPPVQEALIKRFNSIVIDKLVLKDVPTYQAIQRLDEAGRDNDPKHLGVPIVVYLPTEFSDRKITISLNHVTLRQAVEEVLKQTSLTYEIDTDKVIIALTDLFPHFLKDVPKY